MDVDEIKAAVANAKRIRLYNAEQKANKNNRKRIRDYEAEQAAKKAKKYSKDAADARIAPNMDRGADPKDIGDRSANAAASRRAVKDKPKPKKPAYVMPEQTTPSMVDTGQGIMSPRVDFSDATTAPNMGARIAEAVQERNRLRIDPAAEEYRALLGESSTQAGEDPMDSARRMMGGMKRGGAVKKMARGGAVKASRGDGCAQRGKTKGRMV